MQPSQSSLSGIPEDVMEEFRHAFSLFDKNGDGFISIDELSAVFKALGQNLTTEEIQDMLNDIDTDGDGRIDFPEFLTMMSKSISTVTEEEELRETFCVFDKDSDGRISERELETALISLGERLSRSEIKALLKEADTNGDGYIDFAEFCALMKKK